MNEEQAIRNQQMEAVRKKAQEYNQKLKETGEAHYYEIAANAAEFCQGILANAAVMQMLIGDIMGSKKITSISQLPIPTMADIQEAMLSAVDLSYRVALQHDVLSRDIEHMNYNHCRFRVPSAAELTPPPN